MLGPTKSFSGLSHLFLAVWAELVTQRIGARWSQWNSSSNNRPSSQWKGSQAAARTAKLNSLRMARAGRRAMEGGGEVKERETTVRSQRKELDTRVTRNVTEIYQLLRMNSFKYCGSRDVTLAKLQGQEVPTFLGIQKSFNPCGCGTGL